MSLDDKQKKVLAGMLIGALVAISTVVLSAWFNPLSYNINMSHAERLSIGIQSLTLPALCLMVAIGRIARYRFFSPSDIDGSITDSSQTLRLLQSLLQNTLEQFVLAIAAYLLWSVTMPISWLSVPALAGVLFAIGRVLFFMGYRHGAPARAVGFTLAFYTSVLMLATVAITLLYRLLLS